MTVLRIAAGFVPAATVIIAGHALRPGSGSRHVAPMRLGVLRAAVVVGAAAVLAVEGLSALHAVTAPAIAAFWSVALGAAAGTAVLRHHRERRRARPEVPGPRTEGRGTWRQGWETVRDGWQAASAVERTVGLALAGLVLLELVLALAASPNNYDSYFYHLPKVEHWVAQRDVDPYPTVILPQVILVPGAEYLLLHLRLLTGGDALYNLVQWAAGVGAAVAVSRSACQLGAGRLGQLLAASVVATAPMVVLQSTSTQTDLTAAAWIAVTASFVLDDLRGRTGVAGLGGGGAGPGLAAVTKSTGLLCLGPLLLRWGLARIRADRATGGLPRRLAGLGRIAVAGVVVLTVALTIVGPFMLRMQRTFGGPLGSAEHSDGLTLERHDPGTLLVNGLRMATSTLVVPVPAVNRAVADGVIGLAHAIGVDPQDPRTTLSHGRYPDPRWGPDEDHAPFPLQSIAILIAVVAAFGWRRVPGMVRGYGAVVVLTMIAYASVLKWQLWGNRLMVPVIAVGAPLAGWWLGRVARAARFAPGRLAAGALALALLAGFAGGYASVLLGWPRRLVGHDSVFVTDRWQQRFLRIPQAAESYRYAAAAVAGTGAKRIGIVARAADDWEYPWWLLLPGRDLVSMRSMVPGHPAAAPSSVDALVCVGPPAECMAYAPPGWRYVSDSNWIGAALPPDGGAQVDGGGRTGGDQKSA